MKDPVTGIAIQRFFLLASRKGCVVCTSHLPCVNTKQQRKILLYTVPDLVS